MGVGMRFNAMLRAFDSSPATMEAPTALVLVAFIALLGFQAYALYLGQPFDPQGFGMAVGMVMTGGGAASYGQGYMMRSRVHYRAGLSRLTTLKQTGSAKVDDPDGGA